MRSVASASTQIILKVPMSENGELNSHAGFDTNEHQPAYVYIPAGVVDNTPSRPAKRRKVGRSRASVTEASDARQKVNFESRLDGLESIECAAQRLELFGQAWSATENQIQAILDKANEDTLAEVTSFINGTTETDLPGRIPSGFIVTGPNIASQGLLFKQISSRLKSDVNGPVVILRSGDASNLKAVLKQLIRDATNQKLSLDDEEAPSFEHEGRKLLNYDLEILHGFVKARGSEAVVIAFQDSEAFDTNLVADLVSLFSSWLDRIPFKLLFGIATSVELFHERLSRSASRCLYGAQFDVEQTSSLIERIFLRAVAGAEAPIRLSTAVVSCLMERQQDHVQSVQSFIAALKYAYMCHFYENALSFLASGHTALTPLEYLQPVHYRAMRILPSYRQLIQGLIDSGELARAKSLLDEDDAVLLEETKTALASRTSGITQLLRAMHLLSSALTEPVSQIELYMSIFEGKLSESVFVRVALDSIKRMTPEELVRFLQKIIEAVQTGSSAMELDGWADHDPELITAITGLSKQISELEAVASKSGQPVRSSYAIHSKGLRTTVIAQRVQLSYENSTLSEQDKEFTVLVDRLSELLVNYLTLQNPQDMFLNEVWLYDSVKQHRAVFQPRPRAAIERALSAPYDYINCECCDPVEGLSSTHPATAILYQMYLETGSLINVFDLWSAFFEMISGGEEQKMNERDALALFYRALADVKSLGMVKQSKKKADHLAKVAWKGL